MQGKITVQGKPLLEGSLLFYPADNQPPSSGTINPDGTFSVMTGQEIGLPIGLYTVTAFAAAPPEEGGNLLVPFKYLRRETSDLKVRIYQGRNRVALDLRE